ncbi:eisosome protein 1-like isoform X2 [Alligator sinensis]|uniref:Eisosome protein 1-like isoform X2 n=1 Tax=Alligator sinensis TaxID=38654 RepID=A0A1U8DDL1_ALLSI|nr:eisosome protein 1-like isoform X2 [Alligator sinensis]
MPFPSFLGHHGDSILPRLSKSRHLLYLQATMEAEDLRLALERQRDENRELVETLLQLEKEHGQLQRDQSQLKEEVARLQHTQTMSEEPDGILEELSALQTSLAEREQEIKVLKQQRQCLEAEKQELRCSIQELMTENLGLTKGNFRTHQQLLEAERALKQLKVDLQQAKDERDKREKDLYKEQHRSAELEEILREHAEIKEVLQGKINQLQDELEDSEQQKALRTSWYLRDVASPTGCGHGLLYAQFHELRFFSCSCVVQAVIGAFHFAIFHDNKATNDEKKQGYASQLGEEGRECR